MRAPLCDILLSLFLIGCSQNTPQQVTDDKDKPPPGVVDPISGGTIKLESCGYSITTRDGASAPAPGKAELGADPTPHSIHLGIAGDPARSITVVWRTSDDATLATMVQYGTAGKLEQSAEGVTFYYETPNRGPVRIHEAHLCGLMPATEYSYRVGGRGEDGKEAWSEASTFRTAPDLAQSPNAQVVIAVLGDTRGGYGHWGQALRQADQLGPPDLILFSGDAVTLGTLQSEWDQYFRQAEPLLRKVPLIGTHGNHEANAVHYYSQFAFPGNEEYFGLQYGPAHITVVNDTPLDPAELGGRGKDFLDSDLRAAGASPWKLAMHHRSLWSASNHRGDQKLLALWGPVIDRHKVDMVLSGHDHNYERTKPMRGMLPQPSFSDGTVFVIAGSAGAPLYDNGKDFWTEKSEKTRSLVLLKVRKGVLEMRAYRDDGTALDSLTIMKGP